jgi:hypothetical protein
MLERVKEHPAIAAAIIFASGVTFAFILADQLVYRRAQLIADFERKQLEERLSKVDAQREAAERQAAAAVRNPQELKLAQGEVRRLTDLLKACNERVAAQKPAILEASSSKDEKVLTDCLGALGAARHEVNVARTKLTDLEQADASRSYETTATIKRLEREIQKYERTSEYRGYLEPQSVYPKGLHDVVLGSRIKEAEQKLSAFKPRLTDDWLEVTLPAGPFQKAIYYHDRETDDPEIFIINFVFRDNMARDAVRNDMICAFGGRGMVTEVDGRVLAWVDSAGVKATLSQSGYQLRGKR